MQLLILIHSKDCSGVFHGYRGNSGAKAQDPERVVEMTPPLRSRKPQLSATGLATQPPLAADEGCSQVALGPPVCSDRLWSTGTPLMKLC